MSFLAFKVSLTPLFDRNYIFTLVDPLNAGFTMKVTQLRNATIVLEFDDKVILVDPMLAPKGAIPTLKYLTRKRRRNPLVELPEQASDILPKVTHCLITHCQKGHFDHLDRAAVKWLRDKEIPIMCSEDDADFLRKKGLQVQALSLRQGNVFFRGTIDLIPCLHGRGVVGKMMAHGVGYYIQISGEPTLYISGDTVLTETIQRFVLEQQPDVMVVPAGGALFDVGSEVIMGFDDVMAVSRLATGTVVANHLEALDHCPVTREQLRAEIVRRGEEHRILVPDDGQSMVFSDIRLKVS